jgi:hypothetical protein
MGAAASQLDFDSMDLYAILEVSDNATVEEIKVSRCKSFCSNCCERCLQNIRSARIVRKLLSTTRTKTRMISKEPRGGSAAF